MLILAVQMAEKHEAAPTAMKPPKAYRETVKIGPTSSWNKITLVLIHVVFDRNEISDLQDFVDAKYFQTPAIDEKCYEGNLLGKGAKRRLQQNHTSVRGCKRG
jgi:hypothetical protein